jgi:stage III sporulation protein AE
LALAYDFSGVYQNLSDEASRALSELGVTSADADALSALSFENVMAALSKMAGSGMTAPLKGLITMTAVLLLCSMLTAYQNSLTESGETVQTVAVLCLSGAVAVPAVGFIGTAGDVIAQCANLFLAYIPIMAVMLAASGKAVSSASYQALTVAAGQGVMRVSSDMILPLLHIFLGIAVSSGIAPQVGLGGFLSLITKLTKWLLGFVMAIFTAVLSLRQAASGALDSLGSKAARFALSSFVPVVGGALSEAYKTVQGSLHVLRSGLGIFVILALAFTFLPVLLQGLGWSLCLFVGKALAEALGVSHCAKLLEALGTVFSTLTAVLLCVPAVLLIAAAAAFAIGGEA